MPRHSRWLIAAAAALLVGLAHAWGSSWLSVLLVSGSVIAWACAPWPVAMGWRPSAAIILVLIAAAAPILVAWPLAQRYHGVPRGGSALLHAWCAGGVMAVAAGVALRIAPRGTAAWRFIPAAAALGGACLLLLVSGAFYPLPISGRDAPVVVGLAHLTPLRLAMADGMVLDGRLYRPHGHSRGLVVFTHGLGGWKEAWLNHLRLFLQDDWSVLAYDLRGHGRSSLGACTYGAKEADDLAQVWTVARGLAAGQAMAAYGVSLGGSITLLAAPRLDGCALIVVESAFGDLGSLIDRQVSAPVRWMGEGVAATMLGVDLERIRPVACAMPAGCDLLVGWIADDAVIPAAQSRAIAAAHADSRSYEMAHGVHLDLIVDEPWRAAVRAALARVHSAPPPAHGSQPSRER